MMHHFKKCVSNPGLGLFLIRLALGIIFVYHGIAKFSDMQNTLGFFNMVFPTAGTLAMILAWVVPIIELVGGIAMLLGVFTRIAGKLLALVMIGALIFVKSKMPFMAAEIDIILLAASLCIVVSGPGKFALGRYCKKCHGMMCNCGKGGTCDHCDTCKDGCSGHELKNN